MQSGNVRYWTALAQDLETWCRDDALTRCGDPDMSLAICMDEFDLWPVVPNECIGDLQTMIEMDREFEQQQSGITLGFSYGGALHDGPGPERGEMGSLLASDWLEIVEDTGIWLDGYKWFLVETPIGTGYHWGGNFCTEGEDVIEGVYGTCDQLATLRTEGGAPSRVTSFYNVTRPALISSGSRTPP